MKRRELLLGRIPWLSSFEGKDLIVIASLLPSPSTLSAVFSFALILAGLRVEGQVKFPAPALPNDTTVEDFIIDIRWDVSH